MASPVNILICHSGRLLAECLSLTLEQSFGNVCSLIDVVGEHASDPAFNTAADLLIVESCLPPEVLNMVLERVRRRDHECKVLLLVPCHVVDRVIEFATLGADGCILEDSSLDDLRSAIQTILAGESYCSPQLANALFVRMGKLDDQHEWARHLDTVRLTSREREILELITWERLGNKQIARRLRISLYTVKNHVHNIIEKLGVQDRYEAADVATRRRLLVIGAQ